MFKKVCLFSGNANPVLAASIGQYLETPLGKCKITRFSDGESFVEIGENVRGVDAFVIQSTSTPTNDNVMELLIMADAHALVWLHQQAWLRPDESLAPWWRAMIREFSLRET